MAQFPLDLMVVDALLPDLVHHDRSPAAFIVYLCLFRHAFDHNWSVRMSHQGLADATGLSRSAVQTALANLNRRQLVLSTRASPTAVPMHRIQRPWQRLARGAKG